MDATSHVSEDASAKNVESLAQAFIYVLRHAQDNNDHERHPLPGVSADKRVQENVKNNRYAAR